MANYSLGEIDALARKATRGAGYSWGIAEEAGKAVRWLSAYGFSGAETLAKYLSIVANKPQDFIPQLQNNSAKSDADLKNAIAFANNNASLCPLYGGTLINDLGHQLQVNKTLSFDNMLFPLLALSQAGRIAEAYDINVSFSYADKVIICNATGIQLNDTPPHLSMLFILPIKLMLFARDSKVISVIHTFPAHKVDQSQQQR